MEVHVCFEPSGRSVRVPAGTRLLEATRRASLPMASACGAESICGRCGVEILRAAAALPAETEEERNVKQRNRVDPQLRLACRIAVSADLVVTTRYW